jgi:hypothetical protein
MGMECQIGGLTGPTGVFGFGIVITTDPTIDLHPFGCLIPNGG